MQKPSMAGAKSDLGREVEEAMKAVRTSFLELLAAATAANEGVPIRKAPDLQRFLGIPSTLSWRVFRVANGTNLMSEANAVPGSKAARKLIQAASAKGIPSKTIDAMSESLSAFEALVQSHADSRRSFDRIAAGLNSESVGVGNVMYRKAAFEANSQIWGALARTRLSSIIIRPANDEFADILGLFGTVDYYNLHGEIPFIVTKSSFVHKITGTDLGQPLSKDITEPGKTVLSDFCTSPLPEFKHYVDEDGDMRVEVSPTDVGRQNAVSVFVAEVIRAVANRCRIGDDRVFGSLTNIALPIATQIIDLVIARDTYCAPDELLSPRAYMISNVGAERITFDTVTTKLSKYILDQPEVYHLGRGARMLETPDVPRYPEMFRSVCRKLNWDESEFDVYRCRVEYPVMPSTIAIGFDLPVKI